MRELCLLLLLAACADGDGTVFEEPETPTEVESAPAPAERMIPLCPGEDAPAAGECQTLVYGEHGYCNRWNACP